MKVPLIMSKSVWLQLLHLKMFDDHLSFSYQMYRPELYSVVKLSKLQFRIFKTCCSFLTMAILSFCCCHNTQVLIWFSWYDIYYDYVTRKSISFCVVYCSEIGLGTISTFAEEDYNSRCNHAHQCKQNYLWLEFTVWRMFRTNYN